MKFHTSKTFFVPFAAIIFLLSLSSCGKDYDLLSEYVVRDTAKKTILSVPTGSTTFGTSINDALNCTIVQEHN